MTKFYKDKNNNIASLWSNEARKAIRIYYCVCPISAPNNVPLRVYTGAVYSQIDIKDMFNFRTDPSQLNSLKTSFVCVWKTSITVVV